MYYLFDSLIESLFVSLTDSFMNSLIVSLNNSLVDELVGWTKSKFLGSEV